MSAATTLVGVGWGQTVDSRIAPDVRALEENFKVKITGGYATTGHAADGDHPKGLAVDIVPDTARGGTWADVNKLAGWAAEHADVFRFVGYDGRFGTTAWPNHGEGKHLHLSWHGGGTAGDTKPLKTISSDKSLLDTIGGGLGGGLSTIGQAAVAVIPGGTAASAALGAAGGVKGAVTGTVDAAKTAADVSGAVVDFLKDPRKALLYLLLLATGGALAVTGLLYALGTTPRGAAQGAVKIAAMATGPGKAAAVVA